MKKTIGRRALIITLVAALHCIAAAEGIVLIRDICADKENRAYLSQITPDYKASVSDIEEVSNKYVRPMYLRTTAYPMTAMTCRIICAISISETRGKIIAETVSP